MTQTIIAYKHGSYFLYYVAVSRRHRVEQAIVLRSDLA